MEGWVYKKRTDVIPKVYQRRYMRLDDGSHEIEYFKQVSDLKSKGSIDLLSLRRVWPTDPSEIGKDKHAKLYKDFAVTLQTDQRTWFLLFEDTKQYNEWILAIWKACDQKQCVMHKSLLDSVPGLRTATLPKAGAAALQAEPEFTAVAAPSIRRIPEAPFRGDDGGSIASSGGGIGGGGQGGGAGPAQAGAGERAGQSTRKLPTQQDIQFDLDDDGDDAILNSYTPSHTASGGGGARPEKGGGGAAQEQEAAPAKKMFSLGSMFGGGSKGGGSSAVEDSSVSTTMPNPWDSSGGGGGSGPGHGQQRGRGRGGPMQPGQRGRGRGGPPRGRGGAVIEMQVRSEGEPVRNPFAGAPGRGGGRGGPGRGAGRGGPQARGGPRGRGRGRGAGPAGLARPLLDEEDSNDGSSEDGESSSGEDTADSEDSEEEGEEDDDEEEGKGSKGAGCCVIM